MNGENCQTGMGHLPIRGEEKLVVTLVLRSSFTGSAIRFNQESILSLQCLSLPQRILLVLAHLGIRRAMNRVFFIERSVFVRFDALCQRLLGTFRDGLVRYSSILASSSSIQHDREITCQEGGGEDRPRC